LQNNLPAGRAWAKSEGRICFGEAEMSEPLSEANRSQGNEPALDVGFDSYQSLANSNIRIIVARDVVPPFRFKAGGWELLRSSAEPGSAIRARIAEKGFFLFRVNEDQTGGTELTDLSGPSPDGIKVE